MYFCDDKAKFSASLLQSSVSHDSSEIILICWFAAQETFITIINVENSLLLSIFVEIVFFFQNSLINRKFNNFYSKQKSFVT